MTPSGMCVLPGILLVFLFFAAPSQGQESGVLLQESFDTTALPSLPAGWRSSQKKVPGANDWVTTSSTPYSAPAAVLASNATLEQWLETPVLSCTGLTPESVRMRIRRSGTFGAPVRVEISTDSGRTFPLLAGVVPKETGNGAYAHVELPVPSAAAGQPSIIVRWRISPDSVGVSGTLRMDDVRVVSPAVAEYSADSVIINEFMYAPAAGEPEWIEILNTGFRVQNLKGWSISDGVAATRHIIAVNPVLLEPGELAVVTSDSSSLTGRRPGISAKVLQPAALPSLNNTGDNLHLFNASGGCKDSVSYVPGWGGSAGVSLERIDALAGGNCAENWGSSTDTAGATPGRMNSIARRGFDLAVLKVRSAPECDAHACEVEVTVRNTGRNPASSWSILLADDIDRDSVARDAEIIGRLPGAGTLAPGDSTICAVPWPSPVPGKHSIRAVIVMAEDQRPANNGMSAAIIVPIPPGSVRINEILYEPLSGMPEFVEVINASSSPIDLDGCTLSDEAVAGESCNCWTIGGKAYRLQKGECLAVLADSTGPAWFPSLRAPHAGAMISMGESSLGLNNDGDMIRLKSAAGVLLDSVRYDPSFHSRDIRTTQGRSLELITPLWDAAGGTNWSTCVDPAGGTPAARNSISVEVLPSAASVSAWPNPFSPDGDGHDDFCLVNVTLPSRTSLVRIRIFDARGRIIRDLANLVPAGTQGSIAWDGRDDEGRRGRIGIYVVLVEAVDAEGGIAVSAKCAVVLAGNL